MKDPIRKKILKGTVVLALLVLTGHFFLTAVYLAPESMVPGKVLAVSKGYMVPMFHQRLKVFAPEPPVDEPRLYFRCTFSDGASTDWVDPGKELLEKHYQYRVSNYQKKYRLYEGVANNLAGMHYRLTYQKEQGHDTTAAYQEAVLEHVCYQLAQRYVKKHAANLFADQEIVLFEMQTNRIARMTNEETQMVQYPAFSP